MTREFENMLYLFGCGATGKEPLAEHCTEIRKIRDVSITQNVWPVVYSALRAKILSGEIKIPVEITQKLELSFQANIAKTIQKNEFSKNTIRTLEENSVECCLFKGMTLSRFYHIPETRISSDVDILIDAENEDKAVEVLEKLGYDVKDRADYDHHRSAIHPIGGEMEIHISVMRKNWNDIIFMNEIGYSNERLEMENGIKTFGVNDMLMNTTTHFIKHFVRRGAGPRHIMDMLLCMKKYETHIDWDNFYAIMKKLRYDVLIDVAKTVGVKYWGFSFERYNEAEEEVIEQFLTDMEKGGVFGGNDSKRAETYARFTQRRKKLSPSEYKKYSTTNMDRTFFHKLFPNREFMKKAYGMKDDRFLSLISAHIKRAFNIIRNLITRKKDFNTYMYGESKEVSLQVKERIDLFEKLGIID